MTPILYSRAQAATMLSISLRSLAYLIARGHIEVCRVGRRVLVHQKEIERFVDRNREVLHSRKVRAIA